MGKERDRDYVAQLLARYPRSEGVRLVARLRDLWIWVFGAWLRWRKPVL